MNDLKPRPIYPKALSYDERQKRDQAYRTLREARQPDFGALRIAFVLSAIFTLILIAVRYASLLNIITAVSAAFMSLIVVVFGYVQAYHYAEGFFRRHSKRPFTFFALYYGCVFLLPLALINLGLLSSNMLLTMPLTTVGGVILGHFVISYLLAGHFIGYRKH